MRLFSKFLSVAFILLTIGVVSAFAKGGSPLETTDGFVCPVLGGQAGGDHGNSSPDIFVTIAGDDTTIIGPDLNVPVHATNDNGAGSPGADHASPGDKGYTAIWKK